MSDPTVITVSNHKGGVGTTTTAIHLSHCYARHGKQVLLVDLARQSQCSIFLGIKPQPSVFDFLTRPGQPLAEVAVEARPNLHILRGDGDTTFAQANASARGFEIDYIKQGIVDAAAAYDYVIIDTAPSGLCQEAAIYCADVIIVPAPVDYPGLDATANFRAFVFSLQEKWGRRVALSLLLPMFVDLRTNDAKINLSRLERAFGGRMLPTVPMRVRMREAIAFGATIFEYAPNEDLVTIYEQICQQIEHVHQISLQPDPFKKPTPKPPVRVELKTEVDDVDLAWDYSVYDNLVSTALQKAAANIKGRLKRAAKDIFVIGSELIKCKELLPYGDWGTWLDSEFTMHENTALNFMRVAERFGDRSTYFAELSPSVLYMMASPSTPDEAVAKIEKMVRSGEPVRVATATRIIADAKDEVLPRPMAHGHQGEPLPTPPLRVVTPSTDARNRLAALQQAEYLMGQVVAVLLNDEATAGADCDYVLSEQRRLRDFLRDWLKAAGC